LHDHTLRPKTLFATHYHEMNELATSHSRIANFHVSVKEIKNKIIFLRKMVSGGSEHSFGIHVAQLAGIPPQVFQRAQAILEELESQREGLDRSVPTSQSATALQLSMFTVDDNLGQRLKDELGKIDINTLTPVEALMKLSQLKNIIKKGT
nr:DNA mismatch repair protein MutS [Bacteroidota bacterium]